MDKNKLKVLHKEKLPFGLLEDIKSVNHSHLLKRYWKNTKDMKKTLIDDGVLTLHTPISKNNALYLTGKIKVSALHDLWNKNMGFKFNEDTYIGHDYPKGDFINRENKLFYVMLVKKKQIYITNQDIKDILSVCSPSYIFTNKIVWQLVDGKDYNIFPWKRLIQKERKEERLKLDILQTLKGEKHHD